MFRKILSLKEPLTCEKWDCNCTFNRQRSCCCAANDLFDLEDSTYMRIKNLWMGISTLKYSVMELSESYKVAFTASMDPGKYRSTGGCFGIFSTNVPVPYSKVMLNEGYGYNPVMGVFTAPRAGVYVFSATVASAVDTRDRLYHQIQMMLNYEVVASVWENNREDPEDSATQTAVLKLERGDQVYMKLMFGRKICRHMDHNVFSGYMLYPKTEYTE
ncbi:cerebellin 18 [Halichoeres trimaculatus]|uniref:cerebellin 18 n=1 Tax=Halichoeres trimaculatus TaxID=147232 RepID=UPI003D9E8884